MECSLVVECMHDMMIPDRMCILSGRLAECEMILTERMHILKEDKCTTGVLYSIGVGAQVIALCQL